MPFASLPTVEKCCCCVPLKLGCILLAVYKIISCYDHYYLLKECKDLHEKMLVVLNAIYFMNWALGTMVLLSAIVFLVGLIALKPALRVADALVVSVLVAAVCKVVYGLLVYVRLRQHEVKCAFFNDGKSPNGSQAADGMTMPHYMAFLMFVPDAVLDAYLMCCVNSYVLMATPPPGPVDPPMPP